MSIKSSFNDPCIQILYDHIVIDYQRYFSLVNFLDNSSMSISRYRVFDFIIHNNQYDDIHNLLELYTDNTIDYRINEFLYQLEAFYHKTMIILLP